MKPMEIINLISINMINLFKLPIYKVITKNKLNKEITKLCEELRKKDIFEVSENMYTFLKSIPKEILDNCEIKVFPMNMEMKIDKAVVVYNAAKSEVEVYSSKSNMCYVIYKKARIPAPILKDWVTVDCNIRNFYIELISNISYELAFN